MCLPHRPFDCGVHHCSKSCHPPSLVPSPCPRSPCLVTHCPCGKHPISPSSAPHFPPGTLLTRTICTDPIPTCESICMKPLEGCSHPCSVKCHIGPCPPCGRMIVRPCRCGATTRDVKCSDDQRHMAVRHDPAVSDADSNEILCDRPCGVLRTCGRHQCNRLCCPLASLAKKKGKKPINKKSTLGDLDGVLDEAGWHECDLICGKVLGCGIHRCEEKDHKGVCPPCLRSSFEEVCRELDLQSSLLQQIHKLDHMQMWSYNSRAADSLWHSCQLHLPLCAPAFGLRAPQSTARMS